MLIKVSSAANYGIDTLGVDVEVNIASRGFPAFDIVGLPSKAVAESRDRVRTALVNSDFEFPNRKITINLAPADLPKEGSFYDLPIAVGIMSATLGLKVPEKSIFYGELSLDGCLRHTKGSLLISIYAKENGFENIFVPASSANEASVIKGINVYAIESIEQLYSHLSGNKTMSVHVFKKVNEVAEEDNKIYDMQDVLGQFQAKRAVEIAVAGGHNMLMVGPPGGGKTMLAKAIPSILPSLSFEESLEVTKVYSAAGIIKPDQALILKRQTRSPHHTISYAGMVGGGTIPKPGEISLAHRGVLFLDELAEFSRYVLETLRQPMEDGEVTVSRSQGSVTYPCRFIFIAASNPCPCGYLNHPTRTCKCTQNQVSRYNKKISGPLLDRVDLYVNVNSVEPDELNLHKLRLKECENSATIKNRISTARDIQLKRFKGKNLYTNAEMKNNDLSNYCVLETQVEMLLKQAVRKFNLSARSYFKTIKVSRTIADLEGSAEIKEHHMAEALQYRAKS